MKLSQFLENFCKISNNPCDLLKLRRLFCLNGEHLVLLCELYMYIV